MDSGVRDSKVNPIGDLEAEEEGPMEKVRKDDDDEEESLLVPKDKGCKEKVKSKAKRKVQWNDTNGDKLAEIREFLPSDVSDSEDDDSDVCFCIIM